MEAIDKLDQYINFYKDRLANSIASYYETPWFHIFRRAEVASDIRYYMNKIETLEEVKRILK